MSEVMPPELKGLVDGVAGVRRLVAEGLVDAGLVVGLRQLADQVDVLWLEVVEVVADLCPTREAAASAQVEAHRRVAGSR